MQDVILEISNYLSLKTARLLCKNIENYNTERYLNNMIHVTATEINDYKKKHDIGVSVVGAEWDLSPNKTIYFCLRSSNIKIDQMKNLPINYKNLDLISYYNILRLRYDHLQMKIAAKNKVICMLQNQLSNIYCNDRMAFSDTFIHLAVNCHLIGLQDIHYIVDTIIPYNNLQSLRPDVFKMYKMVMTYLQNL